MPGKAEKANVKGKKYKANIQRPAYTRAQEPLQDAEGINYDLIVHHKVLYLVICDIALCTYNKSTFLIIFASLGFYYVKQKDLVIRQLVSWRSENHIIF